MTSYIPAMPTIKEMAANDTINYKGNSYTIDSVGSYVDDGGGRGHRTVTITVDGNSTTFTVSTADTIVSSYSISQAGVQTAVWSQSAVA